jgi:hypothetical protein
VCWYVAPFDPGSTLVFNACHGTVPSPGTLSGLIFLFVIAEPPKFTIPAVVLGSTGTTVQTMGTV